MTQRPQSHIMVALIAMSAAMCSLPVSAQSPDSAPESGKASQASDVSQFRNNTAHTGYVDANLTLPLTVLWRNMSEPLMGSAASPVYADGLVYFTAGTHVYAMRADDGSIAWTYPVKKTATSDDATDTPAAGGNFRTTPALSNGFLYVGGDNGELMKIDAKTGAKIWGSKVDGIIRSSPLIDSGTVYFGSEDAHCYAVSADTGARIWTAHLDAGASASPILAGGMLVVGCSDNNLVGINAATGHVTWTIPINSDPRVTPPLYLDNVIYTGSGSEVAALSSHGGTLRWKRTISSEASTPATVGMGNLFIGSQDGKIAAFSDRGRPKWTATLDYPSLGIPLLTNNALLVPTQRGILYAYDPQTGSVLWQYVVQPASTGKGPRKASVDIHTSPILTGNTLFVLSDDGTMSAFRSTAADTVPPRVINTIPGPGRRVAGARIPYEITMIDDGSGIDPSSITLSVDGSKIANTKFDASKNALVVVPAEDQALAVTTALKDGVHQATIVAADWRGNKMTHTWGFSVDNKLNPKGMKFTILEHPEDQQAAPPVNPTPPASSVTSPKTPANPSRGGGVGNEPPPPPAFPAL